MKGLLVLLALSGFYSAVAQQSYTVCQGSVRTLSIAPVPGSNVSYVMQPGAVQSFNGHWTVTVSTTSSYTMNATWTDSANNTFTHSSVVSFVAMPVAKLSTITSPQNFTLGCGTKSTAAVVIVAPPPHLSATMYTVVPDTVSVNTSGWQTKSTFTLSNPGNYYAFAAYAAGPGCYDSIPFTVTQDLNKAVFDSIVLTPPAVQCNNPIITVKAYGFLGKVIVSPTHSITFDHGFDHPVPHTTPGNYTVTSWNYNTNCRADPVITITDARVYPLFSVAPFYTICNTPSVTLTANLHGDTAGSKIIWHSELDWESSGFGPSFVVTKASKYRVTVFNTQNCSTSLLTTGLGCVGIEEYASSSIRFWPNPANNNLTFEFSDGRTRTVSIYSTTSQILKRVIVRSGMEISIDNLAPGIYFAECDGWRGRFVKN